jgi:hypothetical protein
MLVVLQTYTHSLALVLELLLRCYEIKTLNENVRALNFDATMPKQLIKEIHKVRGELPRSVWLYRATVKELVNLTRVGWDGRQI